ncbi:MAG: UDP-3-O-(3-hydroxymyristoyl)glucosamine N-acyltransferase [Myxococcaceae bacterium]
MAGRPLAELVAHVGGRLRGDGSLLIHGVEGLAEAGPADLSFYASHRYRQALATTRAAAVLVPLGEETARPELNLVQVPNPHLAYARISALFHPIFRPTPGVSPKANVHPRARVHPSACVMPFATVEADAELAEGVVLYPGVYVGAGARIGKDSVLYPNVTVRERCLLGERVVLHASAVVGADGFGFAFDAEASAHVKVPQAGIVRIEDDVEVGAASCIDRATTGETVIGRGTKIDNLVQVAHNVRVGPLSILCAQVGISGSADIGSGVVLAGQVGVTGHIHIGDAARVQAQSGVAQDVAPGATVAGSPTVDHWTWLRQSAALPRLAELMREVRALRSRLEALEKETKP